MPLIPVSPCPACPLPLLVLLEAFVTLPQLVNRVQHLFVVILHVLLIFIMNTRLTIIIGLTLAARLKGALVLGVASLARLILAVDLRYAITVYVDLTCNGVLRPLGLINLVYLWDLTLGMHYYSSVVVSRVL